MIEYKIKQPNIFVKCMKSLAIAGDYLLLRFGSGLTTFGKDPSGIYLYLAEFGESMIEVVSDGKIDVFVSLGDLSKILKRFSSLEDFTLSYDGSYVILKVKTNNRRKTFKLSVLDEELSVDLKDKLANLQLNTLFTVNGADLYDAIQDAEIYSEATQLTTIDNIIRMYGSNPSGETETEIELENPATANTHGTYSLSFMKMIVGTMADSDIIVGYDADMPIMFYNKISNDSYVKWYLAPRVTEEEDFDDDD